MWVERIGDSMGDTVVDSVNMLYSGPMRGLGSGLVSGVRNKMLDSPPDSAASKQSAA